MEQKNVLHWRRLQDIFSTFAKFLSFFCFLWCDMWKQVLICQTNDQNVRNLYLNQVYSLYSCWTNIFDGFSLSLAFFVFPYDDHFIKGNFACNYYHLICSYQKRIQNLVKHLQCRAFLQKSWWLLPANCFRKKPHVRCLTEFWIRAKYAPLFMFLITWFTRLSSCFINKKFN